MESDWKFPGGGESKQPRFVRESMKLIIVENCVAFFYVKVIFNV